MAAIYDAVYMVARAIDEDTAKPEALSLDRDEFWSRGGSLYGNLNTVRVSVSFQNPECTIYECTSTL